MRKEDGFLQIEHLKKYYPVKSNGFRFGKNRQVVKAVDDVSLTIQKGEVIGLVGESGCGKSTIVNTILNLTEPTSGSVVFDGRDLYRMSKEELRKERKNIQIVFQDPFWSLNPRRLIKDIIGEPLKVQTKMNSEEILKRVEELLEMLDLPKKSAYMYPHEFSNGERQRIAIARALALTPKLVVLDEPTSSIDILSQVQILKLLNDMISAAETVRMTNEDGTDVSFRLDHRHAVTIDIGNAGGPGFFTIPALFNIVPEFGSANGKLVFQGVYADPWGILEAPMTLLLKNGMIADVQSKKQEDADRLKNWLAKWNDPAIYSVAHTNIGLLPKVRGLCGEGILDERGWGTLNWGFGNVSASEAPPKGQPCVSHFDGMVLDGTVWIDGILVMENGRFVHPELKPYADKICSES